jgi:anti-sigma factor RsiW
MHNVVETHIEGYLDGTLQPVVRREIDSHLASCQECRGELAEARKTHEWMQLLVPEQPLAPGPDFYARVSMRIDAERERRSGWLASLFPVFGRQLGFAMMMFVLLLGGLFLTIRQTEFQDSANEIMAMDAPALHNETPPLNADVQTNREQVMNAIVTQVSAEGD